MLANDEGSLPGLQAKEEASGTEIAVSYPQVIGFDSLQDEWQQGPFLGMPIFTREDINP